MLISILIDPIHFGIERTATVKVSVALFGSLIGVTFGAEQLRSDEGLTLETSAFQIIHGGNSTFINSFDKTKFLFRFEPTAGVEMSNGSR